MRFLSSLPPDKEHPLRQTARAPSQADEPEDILKQRARRRLLGALILVSMLIITLPFIFDAAPTQIAHQANIYIHPPALPSHSTISPPHRTAVPIEAPTQQSKNHVPTSNSAHSALSNGEVIVTPTPNKAVANKTNEAAEKNPAFATHQANAASHFVVQAGVFISEERAHNWLTKLKTSKLPAHIEVKKMPEGERYFLRVGPFSDRTLAELAQKRIKTIGLPSIISESH